VIKRIGVLFIFFLFTVIYAEAYFPDWQTDNDFPALNFQVEPHNFGYAVKLTISNERINEIVKNFQEEDFWQCLLDKIYEVDPECSFTGYIAIQEHYNTTDIYFSCLGTESKKKKISENNKGSDIKIRCSFDTP